MIHLQCPWYQDKAIFNLEIDFAKIGWKTNFRNIIQLYNKDQ